MVEKIEIENKLLAVIIRKDYKSTGIEFFTPKDFSQQLGYMFRQKGYKIKPHNHIPFSRNIFYTKEVLFIKSGKIKIDIYNEDKVFFTSTELYAGDTILLAFGGHGIEVIEDSEIIEVKQGPYAGELDKEFF